METHIGQLRKAVNNYVKAHGYNTVMDASEILMMAGLIESKGNILPSDYCYNRYNNRLKGFKGPFLFEYLDRNQYLLLGENYPFNGLITHKPRHSQEVIVGFWENGNKTLYQV